MEESTIGTVASGGAARARPAAWCHAPGRDAFGRSARALLGLGLAVLFWAHGASANLCPGGVEPFIPTSCDVTVYPSESVESAWLTHGPSAVICLEAGSYTEAVFPPLTFSGGGGLCAYTTSSSSDPSIPGFANVDLAGLQIELGDDSFVYGIWIEPGAISLNATSGFRATVAAVEIGTGGTSDTAFDLGSGAGTSTVAISRITNLGGCCNDGVLFDGSGSTGGVLELRGNYFGNNSARRGGAVFVDGFGTLNAQDNTYFQNTAQDGGGAIYTRNIGSATFSQETFDSNSSDREGGAIYFEDEVDATITDGVFANNDASSDGGAIHFGSDLGGWTTGVEIDGGTQFTDNVAGILGGAIHHSGGQPLDVSNAIFQSNSAASAGALALTSSATVSLWQNTFEDNLATTKGGALDIQSGLVLIYGDTFSGNQAGDGGAIAARVASVDAISATFQNNVAGNLGGAVWAQNATVTTQDSTLSANNAFFGGGIYGNAIDLDLTSSQLVGNLAQEGGGLSLVGSTLTSQNTDYRANQAQVGNGGAILGDSLVALTSLGDRFCANSASSLAGGIRVAGTGGPNVEVRGGLFVGNVANAGAASAIDHRDGTLEIVNASFLGNSSLGVLSVPAMTSRDSLYVNHAGTALQAVAGGTIANNLFFQNAIDFEPGSLPAGNHVGVDPLLGDPMAMDCEDLFAFWHTTGSPLFDAGTSGDVDPDGSTSEIGAYGGSHAQPDGWVDADGNGIPAMFESPSPVPLAPLPLTALGALALAAIGVRQLSARDAERKAP